MRRRLLTLQLFRTNLVSALQCTDLCGKICSSPPQQPENFLLHCWESISVGLWAVHRQREEVGEEIMLCISPWEGAVILKAKQKTRDIRETRVMAAWKRKVMSACSLVFWKGSSCSVLSCTGILNVRLQLSWMLLAPAEWASGAASVWAHSAQLPSVQKRVLQPWGLLK